MYNCFNIITGHGFTRQGMFTVCHSDILHHFINWELIAYVHEFRLRELREMFIMHILICTFSRFNNC